MSKIKDKAKEKAANAREKIVDKLPDKISDKLKKEEKTPPGRITNETIAEHREKILAGGRKFKYPFQYSKHKILINAIVITVVAVIAFSVWLWAMLYRNQATGDFFYYTVKILPLPVAKVDGDYVPYQNYLRRLRANVYYKESQEDRDFTTEDGIRELNYLKRQELETTGKATYAAKIAREKNISVSNEEIDKAVEESLTDSNGAKLTLAEYEKNTLRKYYNWSIDDYRAVLRDQLLVQKVTDQVETFNEDFAALKEQNKVREYIEIQDLE